MASRRDTTPNASSTFLQIDYAKLEARTLAQAMCWEEAVEEVLRGEPWIKCPQCHGAGGYQLIHDEETQCSKCQGQGYFVRYEYKDACRVLGKRMPSKPASGWEDHIKFGIFELAKEPTKFGPEAGIKLNWGDVKTDDDGGSSRADSDAATGQVPGLQRDGNLLQRRQRSR